MSDTTVALLACDLTARSSGCAKPFSSSTTDSAASLRMSLGMSHGKVLGRHELRLQLQAVTGEPAPTD